MQKRLYKPPVNPGDFDLQLFGLEPYSPQGENGTLGWGKEAAGFGQFATPTIWHAFRSWDGPISIGQVARAPRGSKFMPIPGPGGVSGAGTLDVETTADTFPMVLAYTLGKQQITTGSTIYAGTVAANAAIGDKVLKISANSLFGPLLIFPGMSLTVDSGGAHPETFVVTDVDTWFPGGATHTNLTGYVGAPGSGFGFAHTTGAVVVGANTHPINVMNPNTPGNGLPTFTQQVNWFGFACLDYLGCKIDTLALSWKAKTGLTAKVGLAFKQMVVDNSPVAATLSAKNPYIMEQLFVTPNFYGNDMSNGLNSSLTGIDLSINNNLQKDNFAAGAGNTVYNFPEGQGTLSGTLTCGAESLNELTAALAAAGGGPLNLGSLTLPIQGIDLLSPSDPFFIVLVLPKLWIPKLSISGDTSKALSQSVPIVCGESTPGANDIITAYCVGTPTSKY
jgi:hypothetical protein